LPEKIFLQKATERNVFSHELKDEIKFYNQDVNKKSNTEDSIYYILMNIKNLFYSISEATMLEEVTAIENKAIKNYNNIIASNELPNSTKLLLVTQATKIKNGLPCINKLVEQY